MTLHSDGLEYDPASRSMDSSPTSPVALQKAAGGPAVRVRGGMFELETMLAVVGVALVGLALLYLKVDEVQDDALARLAETAPAIESASPAADPAAEIRALASEVALTEPSASELATADAAAEVEALAAEHVEPAAIR